MGELYKQYALTVFKISGFQRLTMNTDYSFFDDPNFFTTLFESFNKYSFQKYFLGFEINEREVYNHLGEFKKITKGILNHHINLICDQYSGEFLSMDTLKELGFSEIKIGRYLVKDIETNPKHLNEIQAIDKLAKEHDLKITFVGVENQDQYNLLLEMDKNCMCQGYYFYRPLEDYKLIDELRKNK
jgi:EAL domain-containing protein (putative c-di-GMP-specific phosphodiesterase class I)